MKIIVLMKQVLNSKQVEFIKNDDIYILNRKKADSIMNYDDGNALEIALKWKEKNKDTHITVLCMGPVGAEDMLRECLAIGVDKTILVTDERLIGADTVATSTYLACAIEKIGEFDLILTGYQSQDGRTGQVGPMVAEKLGVPQMTYVREFYEEKGRLVGIRELGKVDEKIMTKLPCVIVISKQKYCLRGMTLSGIKKAFKKEICIWNYENIYADKGREKDSLARTDVIEIERIERKRKKKIVVFEDYGDEIFDDIIREIRKCVT